MQLKITKILKIILSYYVAIFQKIPKKKNQDKIRNIEAEFAREELVTIIEPEYIVTFLKLSLNQIDAILKSHFGNDDIVYKEGLKLVASLTPSEKYLIYFFLYEYNFNGKLFLSESEVINSHILAGIYSQIPALDRDKFLRTDKEDVEGFEKEDFETMEEYLDYKYALDLDNAERINADLTYLLDRYIYTNEDSGSYYIKISELQPLAIHLMDARVRYGYSGTELLNYMINLFGELGTFNSNEGENLFNNA